MKWLFGALLLLLSHFALAATVINLPFDSSTYWGDPVSTVTALPASGTVGEVRTTIDTGFFYQWGGSSWSLIGGGGGSTPAIGGTLTSGTAGSVLFSGSAVFAQNNNKFFWDDTNYRLGLGTKTPNEQLELTGNLRLAPTAFVFPFATAGTVFMGGDTWIHSFGGSSNFFAGTNAGNYALTGNSDTAVGYLAGSGITSGGQNNFFGYQAGKTITSGSNNNLFGRDAGAGITTNSANTMFGALTTGGNYEGQTVIGSGSGTHANFATAIGYSTGAGANGVSIGHAAGPSLSGDDGDTLIGESAGLNLTSGDHNTATGEYVAATLTTGSSNTLIGSHADVSASGASFQTVIGANAVGTANNTITLGTASEGLVVPDTGGHNGNTPHACTTVSSTAGTATVACAANYIATGGGADCGNTALFVTYSKPTGGPPATGWSASCVTNTAIVVYALCCAY